MNELTDLLRRVLFGRRVRQELELERRVISAPAAIRLARRNDPWTSKLGAELIEPDEVTANRAVLHLLLENAGEWVSGAELDRVGGSEGRRRGRQLRTDWGWPVERQPPPGRRGVWDYRLPLGATGAWPVGRGG